MPKVKKEIKIDISNYSVIFKNGENQIVIDIDKKKAKDIIKKLKKFIKEN